jgi:hypothetical protein
MKSEARNPKFEENPNVPISNEASRPCLPTGRHRAGLPGNVDTITGSALTPLQESVTALPTPAYGQEGGAPSRLARDLNRLKQL